MAKQVRVVRIGKEEAMRRLGDVADDKRFWCNDGKIIKNLAELVVSLNGMSAETYRYHRNEERNDFSRWVRDVVGDTRLAEELGRASSREEAGRAVAERISFLETRI
jgi:hypothetical protein